MSSSPLFGVVVTPDDTPAVLPVAHRRPQPLGGRRHQSS